MTHNQQWVREHDRIGHTPSWHWFPGGRFSHAVCGHVAIPGMPYVTDAPYPPSGEVDLERWCPICMDCWERDQESRKPVIVKPDEIKLQGVHVGFAESREPGTDRNLPEVPPEIPPESFFHPLGGTEVVGVSDNTPTLDEMWSDLKQGHKEAEAETSQEEKEEQFTDVILEEVNVSNIERRICQIERRMHEVETRLDVVEVQWYDDDDDNEDEDYEDNQPELQMVYAKLEVQRRATKELEEKLESRENAYNQLQREFVSYIDSVKVEKETTEADRVFNTNAKIDVMKKEIAKLREDNTALREANDKHQNEAERVAGLYNQQERVNNQKLGELTAQIQKQRRTAIEERDEFTRLEQKCSLLEMQLDSISKLDLKAWEFVTKLAMLSIPQFNRWRLLRNVIDEAKGLMYQLKKFKDAQDEESGQDQSGD